MTPDGDDLEGAATWGAAPFRNVQPALDFADAHRNIAVTVCVASGSACGEYANYAGGDDGAITMHDGISLLGGYESTDWHRCGYGAELRPTSSVGIRFGDDVQNQTRLDGFDLYLPPVQESTLIRADGARGVELSHLSFSSEVDHNSFVGIDAVDAEVSLNQVYLVDLGATAFVSTEEGTVVRAVRSDITIVLSTLAVVARSGTARVVWLEDCTAPVVSNNHLILREVDAAGQMEALLVHGGDGGSFEDNNIESWKDGVTLRDAGTVAVTGRVTVDGDSTDVTAVHVIRTRAFVSGYFTARPDVGWARGVWFDASPGSTLEDSDVVAMARQSAGASPATGVLVSGDVTGLTIEGNDIDVSDSSAALEGISVEDCTGGALSISNNDIQVIGPSYRTGPTPFTAVGIGIAGSCQPRLESNVVLTAGSNGTSNTGIACRAPGTLLDNVVSNEKRDTTAARAEGSATGVSCDGCTEVSRNDVTGLAAIGCVRNCSYSATGMVVAGTGTLVDSNVIGAGCADYGAGLSASGARVQNNMIYGSGGGCQPNTGGTTTGYSVGLWAGANADVHSNFIEGGARFCGPDFSTGDLSVGLSLGAPGGTFRNNVIRASCASVGRGANVAEGSASTDPLAFENNDLDSSTPGATLYRDEGSTALTTIAAVNALADTEAFGNFSASDCAPPLVVGSSCIDQGTPVGAPDHDWDGEARSAAFPDVGPDEWGDLAHEDVCGGVTCTGPGTCENVADSARCLCSDGYKNPSGEPLTCVDRDECTVGNGGCDPLTVCTNSVGGRTCSACPAGYGGSGETGCIDVNECLTNNGGCDALTSCTNTQGGRVCGACPPGYTGTGTTGCVDTVCSPNNGGCDPLTTCTNTNGARVCGDCPVGYSGNGDLGCAPTVNCRPDTCEHGGTCTETPGGYACACPPGIGGPTCDLLYSKLSASGQNTCGLRTDGSLGCWGSPYDGMLTVPSGQFVAVSVGEGFGCGIHSDGQLACWGSTDSGLAKVPSGAFQAVSTGAHYACAIRTDGTLVCWGYNFLGKANPPSGTFTAVAAGSNTACGIRSDGSTTCWGADAPTPPAVAFRALGVGSGYACGLDANGAILCFGAATAGAAPPPSGSFQAIDVRGYGGCALSTEATLACWGENTHGQVNPPPGRFTAFAFGAVHGCAIRDSGVVVCWGYDGDGQSSPACAGHCGPGASCTTGPTGPTCGDCVYGFTGTVDTGCTDVDECLIDSGHCDPLTTCVNRPGGRSCSACPAGYPGTGETGCVHFCDASPCQHSGTCWDADFSYSCSCPPSIRGTNCEIPFTTLAAGDDHVCGVQSDGRITCWGSNRVQQLSAPLGPFSGVSAGSSFSCAILSPAGSIQCWGNVVQGQTQPPDGAFQSIASALAYSCGVAVDGSLHCWGVDMYGAPIATPPEGAFTAVATGYSGRVCGIRTDQTLACFGLDIGDGSPPPAGAFQAVAVGFESCAIGVDGQLSCWDFDAQHAVPPAGSFKSLSIGRKTACAIRDGGDLACWGADDRGQASPPAGTFKSVTVGYQFACAIRTDDTVACWGDNTYGQLEPYAG